MIEKTDDDLESFLLSSYTHPQIPAGEKVKNLLFPSAHLLFTPPLLSMTSLVLAFPSPPGFPLTPAPNEVRGIVRLSYDLKW